MGIILDRAVNIFRLQEDSNNSSKEAYQSYVPLQNISCNIQVGQPEDFLMAGGTGQFGQVHIGFTTASGILEGDKLVDQISGEVFFVRGKSNWETPDIGATHIELLLTEFETTE